jgi:hypothetical protein
MCCTTVPVWQAIRMVILALAAWAAAGSIAASADDPSRRIRVAFSSTVDLGDIPSLMAHADLVGLDQRVLETVDAHADRHTLPDDRSAALQLVDRQVDAVPQELAERQPQAAPPHEGLEVAELAAGELEHPPEWVRRPLEHPAPDERDEILIASLQTATKEVPGFGLVDPVREEPGQPTEEPRADSDLGERQHHRGG